MSRFLDSIPPELHKQFVALSTKGGTVDSDDKLPEKERPLPDKEQGKQKNPSALAAARDAHI
jgi:hypothetical protein